MQNANAQIHSFLLELENQTKKIVDGVATVVKLPDTLFYQIDGGSENTAKSVLAFCELLVARRLVRKLVLARLPVGHTHEDVDAKFAKIWKYIRER